MKSRLDMSSMCHLVSQLESVILMILILIMIYIGLWKAKKFGLVKCYVCIENCMKQAPRSRYVRIHCYLVKLGWCVDPNL